MAAEGGVPGRELVTLTNEVSLTTAPTVSTTRNGHGLLSLIREDRAVGFMPSWFQATPIRVRVRTDETARALRRLDAVDVGLDEPGDDEVLALHESPGDIYASSAFLAALLGLVLAFPTLYALSCVVRALAAGQLTGRSKAKLGFALLSASAWVAVLVLALR